MVQNVVHGDIPSYQTKMNLLEDSLIVLSFIIIVVLTFKNFMFGIGDLAQC